MSASRTTNIYEYTCEQDSTAIDLVELIQWPPRQGERSGDCPIWADLRFGKESISTKHWRIYVDLVHAILGVKLNGCSIVQGTRQGDAARAPEVSKTVSTLDINSTAGSTSASVGAAANPASGFTVKAGLSRGKTSQSTHQVGSESSTKAVELCVSTLPRNRWKIVEPEEDRRLAGAYLHAPKEDETDVHPLCKVETDGDDFGVSLELIATLQDLHLVFEPKDEKWFARWAIWETLNKQAVAKILIQKACTENKQQQPSEEFVLARSSLRGHKSTVEE